MASAPTIGAIETEYAGVRFRSRTEARWAVFFDALGIEWMHEPEAYSNGRITYLPDFWLPQLEMFWEVKPNDRYDRAKPEMLAELTRCNVVVSTADPWNAELTGDGYYSNALKADHLVPMTWREDDSAATIAYQQKLIADGVAEDEVEGIQEVTETFEVLHLDRITCDDLAIAVGNDSRQEHLLRNALSYAAKWRFWSPGSGLPQRCGALARPESINFEPVIQAGVYDERHDRIATEWTDALPRFVQRRIKSVYGRKGVIGVTFHGGAPRWFDDYTLDKSWPTGDCDYFSVSA